MKKQINIRTLVMTTIAFLAIISALAFKSTVGKKYQHMIIISENADNENVFISIDGKEYTRQKKLKREIQGPWDVNPVINLIHQYEAEGWELQSFSGNPNFLYYWLRKEK